MENTNNTKTRIDVYREVRTTISDKESRNKIMSQFIEMDLDDVSLIELKISKLFFASQILTTIIGVVCIGILLYYGEWRSVIIGLTAVVLGKTIYKIIGITYAVSIPLITRFEKSPSSSAALLLVIFDLCYRALLHTIWFGLVFQFVLRNSEFSANVIVYLLWIWVSASWTFRFIYNCTSNSREHVNPGPGPGYVDMFFLDIAAVITLILIYGVGLNLTISMFVFAGIYFLCVVIRAPTAFADPEEFAKPDPVVELWQNVNNRLR